ncbi:unnamed protein product [Bursaphelenchus xylophilus]|uniref:Tyrosine-protein kinase n=1 Tax=Bursaphelenchus xylophilus TaxID=6326 RepID=A0A1I7RP68_BURXY|nr:unnamed protein product [Bursaphelenchus xylophilus]CAG9124617.1 unnamed protein product [Bursaphelenchus xylophilus]
MTFNEEVSDVHYFHGALPDDDADKMLVNEGDFLIQCRPSQDGRLILAVRKKEVFRFHLDRIKNNAVRLMNKQFPTIKDAVAHFQKNQLDLNGDGVVLRRPVPKSKWSITHRDVRMRYKIGSGAYGTVYQGYLTIRDKGQTRKIKVATKRLDSVGKDEQGLIEMMKEARVMQMYEHVNIVKFYGFVIDRTPYLLVMELCQDGSVEDLLRKKGSAVSVARRVDLATQAARGMEYLHMKRCIHRDIATRNCLLSGDTLKLADFGMCRATSIYKVDLSKPQNVRWLAPEVWRTGETKFCTDVYAFGIMIWELFVCPYRSPYSSWKAITVKEQVVNGYRMSTPDLMPDSMATIMKQAWAHNPNTRPTAGELRQMLEDVNKDYNSSMDASANSEDTKEANLTLRTANSVENSANCATARTPARTPPRSARRG